MTIETISNNSISDPIHIKSEEKHTATNQTSNWSKATILGSCLILGACGGSSDDPVPVDPIVAQTSTADLKMAASNNFGNSLDSSVSGASSVTDQNSSTVSISPLGNFFPTTHTGGEDPSGINDADRSLFNSTLALNDDTGERTTREGSRMTIDPDENEVCAEESLGNAAGSMEYQRCTALVADMTVQMDSTSDTAGTVTYFFQNQQLVTIGYAENADSFELNLGGLKTLSDADSALDPDNAGESSIPDTFQGAIRLSSTATNTADGQEAGSVAFEITQSLNIAESGSPDSLAIGPGTLFGMTIDAATGTGSIEFDIGAVQATMVDKYDETTTFDMKGLSATIGVDSNSGDLVVTNLGLGRGPLLVAIDSERVLDMSLDTFGFTVMQSNGEIVLDGGLNLSFFLNEAVGEENAVDVSTLGTLLELTAPTGTGFLETASGLLSVTKGGPFGIMLMEPDSQGVQMTNALTVGAGQCLDQVQQGLETVQAVVACE